MSGNATNFTLRRELIETLCDRTNVAAQTFPLEQWIYWKLITPLSPWEGGFYEQMIGIKKSILRKMARRKSVRGNEFITVIPECEAMLNTCPPAYTDKMVDGRLGHHSAHRLHYTFRLRSSTVCGKRSNVIGST
uniref:Transposase n=1 Tax=Haemonchus placei TaxID=6290 RepID=A0A0N4X8Q2_HAEPC